jgi:hypothetical protein
MIEVRYNGKFFTAPILAGRAQLAFETLIEELVRQGHIKTPKAERLMARGFKTALRPANQSELQFMWERALAAEENDVHVIFSLYDHEGWRFFGRI